MSDTTVTRGISVSSQHLETIVMLTHGLKEEQRSAINARLRYLQRLDFPRAAGSVRGRRITYGLEDTLKFLMVFRYLEWGMSPVRVIRTVVMNWAYLSRALVQAWRCTAMRATDPARAADLRVLLVVEPTALHDVSNDASRLGDQSPETVQVLRPDEIHNPDVEAGLRPVEFLIVDPEALVARLQVALKTICKNYDFEIDDAFRALGALAFGGEVPEERWQFRSPRLRTTNKKAAGA